MNKLLSIIKQSNRDLERGKFLDPFHTNETTLKKLIKVFTQYKIEQKQAIKIINILRKEIILTFKRRVKTISFSKKEEASMKRHLLALKKTLTHDLIKKIDRGQYWIQFLVN